MVDQLLKFDTSAKTNEHDHGADLDTFEQDHANFLKVPPNRIHETYTHDWHETYIFDTTDTRLFYAIK